MRKTSTSRAEKNRHKIKLRIPDLEHSKAAVLRSPCFLDSRRGYQHAVDDNYADVEPRVFRRRVNFEPLALRKTMPPGTMSVISVPEFAELTSVSAAPIRAARSRIPCNPKCPSLPCSATSWSMPAPLSRIRMMRSRE